MARPRSEEARNKIVSSAQALIAEVGVAGFTVDAVSASSGVAKTTIYRHFPSGDDLLIHAIDCMVEPFATPNTGSVRADLIAIFEDIRMALETPMMFETMMGVMLRALVDPEFARLKDELEHVRKLPIRTVLELGVSRGEIRDDIPIDTLIEVVEGPIVARKILTGGMLPAEEIPVFVDLVLGGIQN